LAESFVSKILQTEIRSISKSCPSTTNMYPKIVWHASLRQGFSLDDLVLTALLKVFILCQEAHPTTDTSYGMLYKKVLDLENEPW